MRLPTTPVAKVRVDTASASITTSYTQLLASLTTPANMLHIYNGSTSAMLLATGGSGSETDILYISPGMDMNVPAALVAGTRVAVKSVSGTISSGELIINFFN